MMRGLDIFHLPPKIQASLFSRLFQVSGGIPVGVLSGSWVAGASGCQQQESGDREEAGCGFHWNVPRVVTVAVSGLPSRQSSVYIILSASGGCCVFSPSLLGLLYS